MLPSGRVLASPNGSRRAHRILLLLTNHELQGTRTMSRTVVPSSASRSVPDVRPLPHCLPSSFSSRHGKHLPEKEVRKGPSYHTRNEDELGHFL